MYCHAAQHTLAVLVDNEAGVLSKISGLLSARGFNIESLTVSPTNIPDLSRMTIVIKDVPEAKAQQAYKQLSDIVNVWAVVDYTGSNSLHRELVMVKVRFTSPRRRLAMSCLVVADDWTGASYDHCTPCARAILQVSYMPPSGHFRSDAATNARPGYKELLGAQNHRSVQLKKGRDCIGLRNSMRNHPKPKPDTCLLAGQPSVTWASCLVQKWSTWALATSSSN